MFQKRLLATITKTPSHFAHTPPPTLLKNTVNNNKNNTKINLRLATGQTFTGTSFGSQISKLVVGEAVFTTSLVAYPESMTDPSYAGQILVFTQPLIGNYGVPALKFDKYGLFTDFESGKIQCKGIIVNDYATKYSHWKAVESLGSWCTRFGIPAISGVDTRAVTTLLRDNGTTLAEITTPDLKETCFSTVAGRDKVNWVDGVSVKSKQVFNPDGKFKVALIDCGTKQNIIRDLIKLDVAVHLVPWDFDVSQEMEATGIQYDGVFISNGPGDPKTLPKTVSNIQKLMSPSTSPIIPIFGICMGNLLMGMAAGYSSYKLPYGNRGHNQPVMNTVTNTCVITSQNHGYALKDTDDMTPSGWFTSFRNANDGSNEGIRHETLPFSSVQFHPEAKGGPLDTGYLFEDFVKEVEVYKNEREEGKWFHGKIARKEQVSAI